MREEIEEILALLLLLRGEKDNSGSQSALASLLFEKVLAMPLSQEVQRELAGEISTELADFQAPLHSKYEFLLQDNIYQIQCSIQQHEPFPVLESFGFGSDLTRDQIYTEVSKALMKKCRPALDEIRSLTMADEKKKAADIRNFSQFLSSLDL